MKKRVVIFGSTGFIGNALFCGLREEDGLDVAGISRTIADLTRRASVKGLAWTGGEEAVWVVAAAVTPDRLGPPCACRDANVAIADCVKSLAAQSKPGHIIYLSSIDVYGREGLALPLSEASPIRPANAYAEAKYAAEGLLRDACVAADIPLTVLRLPGVYGVGDTHFGPVRSFVDAAVQRKPITIHGDGEQRRDLLCLHDLVRLVRLLCITPVPGVFNAVTGRSTSLNEMVRLLEGFCGRKLEVRYVWDRSQIDLVFELSDLLRHIPAFAFTTLEIGLRDLYDARMRQEMTGKGDA